MPGGCRVAGRQSGPSDVERISIYNYRSRQATPTPNRPSVAEHDIPGTMGCSRRSPIPVVRFPPVVT